MGHITETQLNPSWHLQYKLWNEKAGFEVLVLGKWKMMKYGNRSMETEVRKQKCGTKVWKQKYGNRSMEVRKKAAHQCLVPTDSRLCL